MRDMAVTRSWMRALVAGLLSVALTSAGVTGPAAEPLGGRLKPLPPESCMPRLQDYTHMWWADGLRNRSADSRMLRCIQTGYYGLALDVEKVELVHLGPLVNTAGYQDVLFETNQRVLDLPPAKLELSVQIGDKRFRCNRSSVVYSGVPFARIVESGRFCQRSDLLRLDLEDEQGNRLDAYGRLEIVAWPDRLILLAEVELTGEKKGGSQEQTDDWKNSRLELSASLEVPGSSGVVRAPSASSRFADRKGRVALDITPPLTDRGSEEHSPNDTSKDEDATRFVQATDMADQQSCPVEYDSDRQWYRVNLDDVVTQGSGQDVLERVKIRLDNPSSTERAFRLMFEKTQRGLSIPGMSPVTGMSPMLRDMAGNPTGIPVQISKNWHKRDNQYPLYQGLWFHGFSMLRLPPESTTEFELSIAYAHWGGVPAASHAQLCLIGWGSNQIWNQAAMGAWGESICFEPDQGQVGGTVLDTRPLMVWAMKRDEPVKWHWTNNVGGADFLVYYDARGNKQWNSRIRSAYRQHGPNLTEVTYAGRSADGKIDLRMTVSLFRSDDIVRGVYRFRYDVRRPVDFSRLVLFQCGGDDYSYTGERSFARGNENGLVEEWDTEWGGNVYRRPPLPCDGRIPWFSMHRAVSRDSSKCGAWANRGFVIRHWDARLGGKPAPPHAAEYAAKVRGTDTSLIDILPPPHVKRLEPGDYVEATVVHIVMPQKAADYYGPNQNLRAALARDADTWKMIYREATGNDLDVRVTQGRLAREYPPLVEVDAQQAADFTVSGGLGYVPITLGGLSRHHGYRLYRVVDGRHELVDQSVHGNDFWQTDYGHTTKKWRRTYTVPLDTPGDARRETRFVFVDGCRANH